MRKHLTSMTIKGNSKATKKAEGKSPVRTPIGKKQAALLNAICYASKEQQRALLRTADESLVKCICECGLNILHGIVKLKPSLKNRLRKYKHFLRQLVPCLGTIKSRQSGGGIIRTGGTVERKRRKFNWRAKKRLMIQKGCGAFLPLLLAPIITTLFSRLFGGKAE